MKVIVFLIIIFIQIIIILNSLLVKYFHKKTKLNDKDSFYRFSHKIIVYYTFFGFIMIFFYKYFKEIKKIDQMEKYIDYKKSHIFLPIDESFINKNEYDKYKSYVRHLKLIKLKFNKNKLYNFLDNIFK